MYSLRFHYFFLTTLHAANVGAFTAPNAVVNYGPIATFQRNGNHYNLREQQQEKEEDAVAVRKKRGLLFHHFDWCPRSSSRLYLSSTDYLESTTTTPNENPSPEEEEEKEEESNVSDIRPLHQNWWPVMASSAMDKSRPHAIEILGMRLVLFFDEESGSWKCLEDVCPHRFAPLSEGRVVISRSDEGEGGSDTGDNCGPAKTCLQCAYHGWEFDGDGSCSKIPQRDGDHATENEKRTPSPVKSFEVQSEVGIVWVWTDPNTNALSKLIPLPVSPLLKRHHEVLGDECVYMRDLPYGFELLGENLSDLSHLPFSHHSVGLLKREIGGPLPLRMLSTLEKLEHAEWEKEYTQHAGTDVSPCLPRFQVEVVDAVKHDPFLLSVSTFFPCPESSTCTIGFYEPCHIRYRRCIPGLSNQHVELFAMPTKAGHSRVFLFNTSDSMSPPKTSPSKEKVSIKSRVASLSPKALKAKVRRKMVRSRMDPTKSRIHLISHQIFDGDGIFLNKQGDRMNRQNLSYKDYCTPTSSDLLVLAYRRYLERAVRKTEESEQTLASSAISGEFYYDDNDRRKLLDRYESHTKYCSVCSKDLEHSKRWLKRWDRAQVAFLGATGSSVTIMTASTIVSLLGFSVPGLLISSSGIASLSASLAVKAAGIKKKGLESKIQQFLFEDYVHADKN